MMNADSLPQSDESMSCSSQFSDAAQNDGNRVDVSNTPCAICLDKGSGFHYGVYTCEGCKVRFATSNGCNYILSEKLLGLNCKLYIYI